MINSILSFILLTSSCLAANPEITGTVSAVGKENIVVSVEGEVPAVKPGQTFTTKDGVKFTLKEIEGPMVVLTRPAQTELEIGDPITLTCKETNPAAEALLTKHEPEKTPEPLKAEPIPES
ncbi:MAG: hypothetical protein ACXVBL_19165, partial [Bdellovibrionota bacterium]